jgi:hypothetical protein
MHSILDPTVGTFAGSIVELTDLLTMDIHIPTEDVLLPTEDIPPASDNILVRFTVGISAAQNRPDGWNTWLTFVISPAEQTPSAPPRRTITK